jgi:hypothetical protein
MPLCQNCGIQVLDSESFCPICGYNITLQWTTYPGVSQAQQDYHQSSSQTHQKPKRRPYGEFFKGSILIASVILIIGILLISMATFIVTNGNGNGKTIFMNMREFDNEMEDYDFYNWGFTSFEPGDTLKIEDKIVYIDSVYEGGETVTYMWFETNHMGEELGDWIEYDSSSGEYYYIDYDITFEGDLTDKYAIGDEVVVTLHIIEIEYNNQIMEYFEEMWNDQYNEPQYQIPSSCLDHANGH